MWYASTVTAEPANEPVTLAEAKAQCRVDGTADDTALNGFIAAGRSYVESYLGTPIITRTVTVKCDSFADFARFPVVPLQSVSSISYIDTAGTNQTLQTSIYETRSDGLTASLALKANQTWPTIQIGSRITVEAIVGADTAPEAVKHAILLLISQWFDERSSLSAMSRPAAAGGDIPELPHAVTALLANHRSFAF